ncbi:hypothetical protein Arcve_1330 [Archaeoglobus veneficus SNP6]|uniref:Uncharacterized protein n=1 Tax=Archaeoglobus veneficus (strain DSM 11195 / SNP6) TaxID=693661 RepID=F2KND2_ARCVS|nr:hypothetical protein Arcve_1330 [Archaeoglobus veneficus SNP6]
MSEFWVNLVARAKFYEEMEKKEVVTNFQQISCRAKIEY